MPLPRDPTKLQILTLLRTEQHTSKEIAQIVGVSAQVVMGMKSQWTLGKYGDPLRAKKVVEAIPAWTYLILSSKGEVYLGATTNLKRRLRSHNSPTNDGFTKGRRWHLLAAKRFETRKGAFDHETTLKKSMSLKSEWKMACIPRATRIVHKFAYSFDPSDWDVSQKFF